LTLAGLQVRIGPSGLDAINFASHPFLLQVGLVPQNGIRRGGKHIGPRLLEDVKT